MSSSIESKTFARFAGEMRSFEKTLYRLVASSFVLAGVAAIAKASPLNAAQIATITLLGTISGSAGVLITYLSWPQRPDELQYETIMFDPAPLTTKVRLSFVVSVAALIGYALISWNEAISLLLGMMGIYFFFRALVTAGLSVRQMEAQERFWNGLDVAGRERWIAYRTGQLRQREESRRVFEKLVREAKEIGAEIDSNIRQTNETIEEFKRQDRRDRIRRILLGVHSATIGSVYRLSFRVRQWLAPGRLLTSGERVRIAREERNFKELIKEYSLKSANEYYEKIVLGQIPSSRDEHSGLGVYRDESGRRHILLKKMELTEATTKELVDSLKFLQNEDGKLSGVTLLLEGGVATEQARALLVNKEIEFFEFTARMNGATSVDSSLAH
jgi:hypothetical protein